MNFIESANVTSIDLTKDKARSKNELLTKIREFVESVREKTASDVPDDFLEAAIFILVKDLKAQVAAVNKAAVKEEQREQNLRLHASPKSTRPVTLIGRKPKRGICHPILLRILDTAYKAHHSLQETLGVEAGNKYTQKAG